MKKLLRIGIPGILTWFIPFVLSFPFFSPERGLLIDEHFFKTIMVVTGAVTGVLMLVWYFKKTTRAYMAEGILVGLVWLAINWVLDFAVLLPMTGMNAGTYFTQIGLRYLALPVFSIGLGYVLNEKMKIV